jgi:hypothetical protein
MNKDFFIELKNQAQQDFSLAHLTQHFHSAKHIVELSDHTVLGPGTWSAFKNNDTLIYSNNTVSGKKHWISGVPLCQWVVVGAIENHQKIIVFVDADKLTIEPVSTMGMENTLTVHFVCDHAPAVRLFDYTDIRMRKITQFNILSFITNHLGLAQALFYDIDQYAKNQNFDYLKKKIKLDIEILHLLWEKEINYDLTQPIGYEWFDRYNLMYAFAKKTLFSVVSMVTELTGSSIYDTSMQTHQRYKDALIYSTHMKNISTAIDLVNFK